MAIDAPTRPDAPPVADRDRLAGRFRAVRRTTGALCDPLGPEDYNLQSMPDASPAKWHLAHTTWFFETFVLAPHEPDHRPFRPEFGFLFNSYYNAIGERIDRSRRGLLTRPTVAEVLAYRADVDARVVALIGSAPATVLAELAPTITLGLHHEQQHQELILTDVKHGLSSNPLRPAYRDGSPTAPAPAVAPPRWIEYEADLRWIGHDPGAAEGDGFAFDNEGPRHRAFVEGFRLASRPVTNGDYLAFVADGGYDRVEHWLSDGWSARKARGWEAPLYWERRDGAWWTFTLAGMRPVAPAEPVCHVSFYEADAFARWAGARLPTEAEWEVAAAEAPRAGNFLESGRSHPAPTPAADGPPGPAALFGDVWEWTRSPYSPYPGYAPAPGALGEYNGKFMCNQFVLRGGSCASPAAHLRASYRNFFPPDARWQFAGLRLARDAP